MSAVFGSSVQKSSREIIPSHSLLEELYTNYTVSELESMLNTQPDEAQLRAWKLSPDAYQSVVAKALEFVRND